MTSTIANAGVPITSGPGAQNRGMCTLSFQGRVFRFRTNPNEIWWSYELLTNVEETYGGRVIQLLGTRLGDLKVKVECGGGGWNYLMEVVLYLRDLLTDQRNGNTAQFAYTTRNWVLNVYSMSIPYADEVTATTREIELDFKIQEDVTNVMSQISLDAEIANLTAGVSPPGVDAHNSYNDISGAVGGLLASAGNFASLFTSPVVDPANPSGPTYAPTGISNTVDDDPEGSNPIGANLFSSIPGVNITLPGGLGNLLGQQ